LWKYCLLANMVITNKQDYLSINERCVFEDEFIYKNSIDT